MLISAILMLQFFPAQKRGYELEIKHKLSAAKDGGYIPGGDDIPSSISPENYDYYIKALKELIIVN